MKLTIDVTQEDIDLGCRIDTTGIKGGCMVWRAFNRCTEGSFPHFKVGYGSIHTYEYLDQMIRDETWNGGKEIELPEHLMSKIIAFDTGQHVEPFSFEVDIPVDTEG